MDYSLKLLKLVKLVKIFKILAKFGFVDVEDILGGIIPTTEDTTVAAE